MYSPPRPKFNPPGKILIEIHVLLIDDDVDDCELFMIATEDLPFKVHCTSVLGCMEGIKYLNNTSPHPDYIFLDLNMPRIDGRECLSMLKSSIHTKEIPVVIFSTSTEHIDQVETLSLGACEFISKPSKISELTNTLENFFTKNLKQHSTNEK